MVCYSNIILLGNSILFYEDLIHWRSDTTYFNLLLLIVSLYIWEFVLHESPKQIWFWKLRAD